ncbi:NAD-dependent protein deacetylase HST1 [Prunus yedoensis var. nudiflora]|uniref:U5 small nuclear ribonucleoprotein TSSC4 n=1 Tax=Prunus yedoensis var. nudiflora TaxID=2094558 RepID=A0A314XFH0_PRUYE|nr:NAD-dependent protein deacetylase HST1 [Prunus yedoensis var. nudiflora]
MEDTFRVRVGKVFGSLAGTPSSGPSSSLSSLWSLTDEEIEKREWNRDKDSPEPELELEREPQPYNLNSKGDFSNELEKDLLDLDEDVEEEEEDEEQHPSESANKHKPDDYNDEEWEIKSSIGLDCTLDYEEEEDGYDKVAVGKENAGDRLYMRDVNDYGIDIGSQEEVPTSFKDFTRDPRANHLAAKIRLQQDAEAAAQIRLQENAETAQKIVSLRVSGNNTPYAIAAEFITSEDATNLKSILKRKTDNQLDPSKSQKRVRFDPNCKSNCHDEGEGAKDIPVQTHSNEDHPSGVPDYLRNPSRYTHYTFDSSSDVDEESNKQAYMDFLNLLRKSNSMEPRAEDAFVDLSKPVIFIPRKKSTDAIMQENDGELGRLGSARQEFAPCRSTPLAIATEDNEDVCAMEEDEPETATDGRTSLQRTGRQYRTKTRSELVE